MKKPVRHFTKAEWDRFAYACPNYVGRWEPTPYLLDRVAAGEVPKEYIGRRNMLSYEDGVGTVLLTEASTSSSTRKEYDNGTFYSQ